MDTALIVFKDKWGTLDTIRDEQILKAFIDAILGEICDAMSNRYVKRDTSRHIHYIDVNNLYGYALMQKLPCKKFSFVNMVEHDQRFISLNKVLNTSDDCDYGN